jgi:uncharacterized LabA/DUF88 family protein
MTPPKTAPDRLAELKALFSGDTHVYIDYANIRKACERLGWRVNLQKLKKALDSTGSVKFIGFYFGTMVGNSGSEGFVARAKKEGFSVVTKPVKCMNLSINVSSISLQSPDILRSFMSETIIRALTVKAIEYLNQQLLDLNKQGKLSLEVRKCNFDVEIASDMRIDHALGKAQTYCLWSGDSDFAHPILQLLEAGRKVVVVARGVTAELNELKPAGLVIHDIRKLKDVICE